VQRAAYGRGAGKKTALAAAFQQQIAAEVEALIGPQAVAQLDFEAIETAARREALKVAAYAVAQRLNADHSDHCGPSLPCACGQLAHYAGRHRKTIQTALGAMTLERAYYHCAACQRGYFPRDGALGIVATSLSPAVTRMIGLVGAMVSFEEGAELLGELAGISINAKQVERTAEALGAEIAADERQRLEPIAPDEIPPTLYLGMDGTGVPMRAAELVGRPGKQPDGSAKTREVKLCTVWSAEGRDAKNVPVRDRGSITYSAAIESAASRDTDSAPSEFAQRVMREASRRGFERATRGVVLGDGAPWIWNLADYHFPGATQIVDLYHARQHLWELAAKLYPADSKQRKTWACRLQRKLDAGQIESLVAELGRFPTSDRKVEEQIRIEAEYFSHNAQRMRYPTFRKQHLFIGSGVIEAGCKTIIGSRLKQSGMFWTLRGANAILALRANHLSGRFEQYWENRVRAA
jgi:hypothetical protein